MKPESVPTETRSALELCQVFGDLVVKTQFAPENALEMAYAHLGLHGGYNDEPAHVQEFLQSLARFFGAEIESRKPRQL